MPRTIKQSTREERKIIVSLHLDGKSERQIANLVNKSKSTVHDIISRYKESGLIENKQREQRPKKLSTRDENMVLRVVKQKPFTSAPQLTVMVQNASGTEVHPETIRRLLRKNQFHGRVARKKPLISEKNRKDRLAFAREYVHKDFVYWSTVLFTDESKFNLFGCDGRGKVWRKPNEELQSKNLRKTVKHGGGSVMVWGCMSASGVGILHFIERTMDKNVYLDILKLNLNDSVRKLGIEKNFKFYQDNDPKHSALIVRNLLLYNCPTFSKRQHKAPTSM